MSLTHDSFTFEASHLKHGLVLVDGDADMNVATGQFMGVIGESHIIDEPKGRNLSCRIVLCGYDTRTELESGFAAIRAKKGKLTGTLNQTIGSDEREWDDTTFTSFEITREPFEDGKASSTDKWCAFGVLRWRQRKGN